jgi:hypothetical protein
MSTKWSATQIMVVKSSRRKTKALLSPKQLQQSLIKSQSSVLCQSLSEPLEELLLARIPAWDGVIKSLLT